MDCIGTTVIGAPGLHPEGGAESRQEWADDLHFIYKLEQLF